MKDLKLEPFLKLHQQIISLENIEKVDDARLAPVNGQTNLDSPAVISFSKSRDATLVRLSESYLEITFSYNTQTLAGLPGTVGVAANSADITFENDVVSKMFDTVELDIANTPVEVVYQSKVASEIVGSVMYSTDEDRYSGARF